MAFAAAALSPAGCAQFGRGEANPIAGSWSLTRNVVTRTDGTRTDVFGTDPKGIALFSPDGYFAVVNTKASLPKFAAGNRMQGTAAENQAVVQGSIALYGTYSVDPSTNTLSLNINSSTWPSWTGTSQKRVYVLNGDELSWTLAAS